MDWPLSGADRCADELRGAVSRPLHRAAHSDDRRAVVAAGCRSAGLPPGRVRAAGGPRPRSPAAVVLDRQRTGPDGLISLLVTSVPDGETSSWVHERLRVGEEVSISGPYGTFVDDPTSTTPCLFLTAGSGVAPVRALIEAALSAGADRSLTLIFSARTEADVIDRERFAGWQARHPQFRFIRTLTRAAGPPPRG